MATGYWRSGYCLSTALGWLPLPAGTTVYLFCAVSVVPYGRLWSKRRTASWRQTRLVQRSKSSAALVDLVPCLASPISLCHSVH
ncbi:hypothetical protein J3F83DRAFT_746973 [Trichoderma novae-zelandiae]